MQRFGITAAIYLDNGLITKAARMFSLISFKANGERIEVANDKAEFYALVYNGVIVEYYTSIEALRLGAYSIQSAIKAQELLTNSEANTVWNASLAA